MPKQKKRQAKKEAKKPAPKKRVDHSKDFAEYVKKNPTASANILLKEFRKTGKSVGNDKGKAIVRDVRGKKKDRKKATRNPVKMVNNPAEAGWKNYFRKYNYVVEYEKINNAGVREPDYITVVSNEKLTKAEIKQAALKLIQEGINEGDAKYNTPFAQRIFRSTIKVVHGVYNENAILG